MLRRFKALVAPTSIALAAGVAAVMDGLLIEPNSLRVREARVPVGPGTEGLVGLRLAHLSDLHVMGTGWKPGTIRAAVEAINDTDIDLVTITGDFLGSGPGAPLIMKLLTDLRADVPRFAVYGNHDHVYGVRRLQTLARSLAQLGIKVLNNDVMPAELPSGRVWLAGVDDAYSYRDDLDSVMERLGRVDGPKILLTHYADLAERLRPGQVDLSLAGHSHGGQIRIPLLGTMMHRAHARTKYGKGLFMVNGNPLYVSAGVGMSGIPVRFLNPPEVPIITFVENCPFRIGARLSPEAECLEAAVSA